MANALIISSDSHVFEPPEQILAGVAADEQARIVGGNAARLYQFDVERMAQA